MSWSYRVVRHAAPNGETYYGMHYVCYDQRGKIELWCETPEGTADTLAGLAAALRLQLEAAERASDRDILDAAQMPGREEKA